MADPFIGEIRPVPYNFAPRGWAFCNGQILAIAQNDALFSLIGTTFGGNGQTTFALPDLRGRTPIGEGTGPGLTPRTLGQTLGAEQASLLPANLPSHTHDVNVAVVPADAFGPGGQLPAVTPRQVYSPTPTGTFANDTVANAGGGTPHNNIQPLMVISYVIALQGIYPSRN